jgi:GTP-binding protein
MRFYDQARVEFRAGHGGAGCVSFRREKYIPKGGPDGGNGGRGGHIILRASSQLGSLLDYKYRQHFEAQNGRPGAGGQKTGPDGEDLTLPIPVGTLIYNDATGDLMADLCEEGQEVVITRGGRGGKGNQHFKSSTMRTPRFAQPGEDGEYLQARLELKLLADVGLVGMPNAGKSSLLRVITAARPKVADYPFTTLAPQLGVVKGAGGRSFVVADIPGLIEGASHGAGLGLEFLRHVERSRLLLHLVDVSVSAENDPLKAFETIQQELQQYNPKLLEKTQWIVLTKIDVAELAHIEDIRDRFREMGYRVFAISSSTHAGLADLVEKMTEWRYHDGVDSHTWRVV